MRPRSFFIFVIITPALAALACGGRVGNDSPRCPAPDQVNDGAACAVEGLTCGSSQEAIDPCTGKATGQAQCSCSNGGWSCDIAYTCPNPPPECPAPSAVSPGTGCTSANMQCVSAQTYVDCNGAAHDLMCTCDGTWICPTPGPDCPPDAGPPPPPPMCPDVSTVTGGSSCTQEGQQCPGNPQLCGGLTVYDAFQCENGQWTDIAPTICDADGGYDGASDAGDDGG